ncbi:hypothetical protein QE152_g31388 [Popillia japonica]|uniref:Uncharacterized protein n=1 Tax=Popillia japonica TaxID=7064 RepID=A0AAW1J1L2_POPJA
MLEEPERSDKNEELDEIRSESSVNDENNDVRESEDKNEERNIQRSKRTKQPPSYFKNYDMAHFALSTEAFVDEVPNSLGCAKTRPNYEYWKAAVEEEIKALQRNETWTVVERPEDVRMIDNNVLKRLNMDDCIETKTPMAAKFSDEIHEDENSLVNKPIR